MEICKTLFTCNPPHISLYIGTLYFRICNVAVDHNRISDSEYRPDYSVNLCRRASSACRASADRQSSSCFGPGVGGVTPPRWEPKAGVWVPREVGIGR